MKLNSAVSPRLWVLKYFMLTVPTERVWPAMWLWQTCQDYVVSHWNLLEQQGATATSSFGLEFFDIIADICSNPSGDCARFVADIARDIQYPAYSSGPAALFVPKASPCIGWFTEVSIANMVEQVHKLCCSATPFVVASSKR